MTLGLQGVRCSSFIHFKHSGRVRLCKIMRNRVGALITAAVTDAARRSAARPGREGDTATGRGTAAGTAAKVPAEAAAAGRGTRGKGRIPATRRSEAMPRPMKRRCVSAMPCCVRFVPMSEAGAGRGSEPVVLSVDEFEALRLIDLEGLNQEECARRMEVARTTVQAIYDRAREKVADFLVNARELRIAGGAYRLSEELGRGGPERHRCGCRWRKSPPPLD